MTDFIPQRIAHAAFNVNIKGFKASTFNGFNLECRMEPCIQETHGSIGIVICLVWCGFGVCVFVVF